VIITTTTTTTTTTSVGILGCFGTVQAAQNTKMKKAKEEWTPEHRTLGMTKME